MNSLFGKIAEVSKAVGSLQPDKRNQQQKYDYISADKILERAGAEMAKVGLVIIPALVDETITTVEYQTGKYRYDCRVDFEMKIADADGNSDTMVWFGRGSDYSVSDKAMYKAITSGHKYFLMKLFNVGVGNEDSEHEEAPTKQVKPQQAPAANGSSQPARLPENKRKQLHAVGVDCYGKEWDSKRADMSAAFGVASSNFWTVEQADKVIAGMNRMISERVAADEPLFDDLTGE